MRIRVFRTRGDAAGAAAQMIALQLRANPFSVLGLPTGRTAVPVYAALARLHADGGADFANARTFNLDEFVGRSGADRTSFRAFMQTHLFGRVNLPREQIQFLDGRASDLHQECARFERAIADAGGIDLMLLGVGANGHIGFNEPGSHVIARTHRARLLPETRRASATMFRGGLRAVPREGLTMGIATMLEARTVVLLATGRAKARATASIAVGRVSTRWPVSFLHLHRDVHVMLDRAAATSLRLSEGHPD